MTAYYNEIDPEAVACLRELVACGVIAPGDVDDRSIKEVTPDDIRGYTQCHFFAGAGLWSIGARLAGWPDSRPLWSASCPCQGESLAGKRLGADDPRHLWPDLFRLIRSERPSIIVGEQVAAAAGTHWLDGTCADLESENYAARAVDIPACAVDAPHIRQRLYWLAMADAEEQRCRAGLREGGAIGHGVVPADGHGGDHLLADPKGFRGGRNQPQRGPEERALDGRADARGDGAMVNTARERWGQGSAAADVFGRRPALAGADVCEPGAMADAIIERRPLPAAGRQPAIEEPFRPGPTYSNGSWWADAEWIRCHDDKARRAKPGIPMLVDGMAGRASVWRLAGNSILPQLAAEVIASIDDEAMSAHPGSELSSQDRKAAT